MSYMRYAVLSADGQRMASGGSDNAAKLWCLPPGGGKPQAKPSPILAGAAGPGGLLGLTVRHLVCQPVGVPMQSMDWGFAHGHGLMCANMFVYIYIYTRSACVALRRL